MAPLLLPAAAFVTAIVADAHGLATLACVVALGLVAHKPARTVAAFALAGLVLARWHGHPPMLTQETRTERFAGAVTGDVRTDENGATFVLALDTGIAVRAHLRDGAIVPGERVVLRGRLVPFDEARNPGEPSRRAIALGEGLAGETQNAHVESFNGRFRDECLNEHEFSTLAEARALIEEWRVDYNASRPHRSLQSRTPEEFVREFPSITHLRTYRRPSSGLPVMTNLQSPSKRTRM